MSNQSPPKRPRLSLQIKAISTGPSIRSSRTLAAVVNPQSPTSFNTLSNVYSTAIDRSSSAPTAVDAAQPKRLSSLPRLQVPTSTAALPDRRTHTPYITTQLPETPLTARPLSPAVAVEMLSFPSTMTATPPLSAGPVEAGHPTVFCFSPEDLQVKEHADSASDEPASALTPAPAPTPTPAPVPALVPAPALPSRGSPGLPSSQPAPAPRRRMTPPAGLLTDQTAPYEHPRMLHSILRNSPLPPRTARSPLSPRRQSQRLLERASRHVMYHSPLTQTITTELYTKSHIDLLCEETSPGSATPRSMMPGFGADPMLAYSGDETRDGGATPGPFEEMRRQMAGLDTAGSGSSTPVSPGGTSSSTTRGGVRKRRQPWREKKQRWVWTLGQDEEEEARLSGAMAALQAAKAAEAAAGQAAAGQTAESGDMGMADGLDVQNPRKRKSTPDPYAVVDGDEADVDMQTPTALLGEQLEGAWMQAATVSARKT